MLNVGIVGAGDFAERHARAFTDVEGVTLVAACRTDARALARFTNRFGGTAYTDYRALLADERIDAVLVATPHHLHADATIAAAQAGKHIFLEKPMASTLRDCDRILAAVENANVKLMVGHISHFVPALCAARSVLAAGELGDIVHTHSIMRRPWMTSNRRPWHLNEASGGGMWLTIGIHVVDQLCWLHGARVQSVSADIKTHFHKQTVDDTGVAFLRFANTTTAIASSIGYRTGVTQFVTEMTCTNGLLYVDHEKGVWVGGNESWRHVPGSESKNWMDDALKSEWRAFVSTIENDAAVPITGEYARDVVAVALAARESARVKFEVSVA